jgi:hypothetical protein
VNRGGVCQGNRVARGRLETAGDGEELAEEEPGSAVARAFALAGDFPRGWAHCMRVKLHRSWVTAMTVAGTDDGGQHVSVKGRAWREQRERVSVKASTRGERRIGFNVAHT